MGKLKRTTYRVELEDGETVYDVEVILADLLRAELEGPKHGISDPRVHSIHTTVLWLWAASLRNNLFEGDFRTFKTACTNFEVVAAEGADVQGVPPTGAGEDSPTAPPSPSPETTATRTPRKRGSSS